MATNYYKADFGITDGMTHYVSGDVFAGSPALDKHLEDTGGKDGDRVLYTQSSKEDYDKYMADKAAGNAPFPDVVGSLPTGEDSLLDSQKDGDKPLVADKATGEPSEGEPVPFDGPQAEARASGEVQAESATPTKSTSTKATSSTSA